MIDEQERCEWVNVSSGTGSPGQSGTKSRKTVVVSVCSDSKFIFTCAMNIYITDIQSYEYTICRLCEKYAVFVFQYISSWLAEMSSVHFEVIVSCLLPHPPEYAQVGSYW